MIKENEGLLYKITTLYTQDRDDREDLYQEIVYQLWKSYHTFKKDSKPSTWMYRVALNTAIYHLKKSKRKVSTVPLDNENLRFPDSRDTFEEEQIQTLYMQIQKLSLMEKGIILLYLEGKNHEEIAIIVGLSVSNIGTRMSRIREKLKTQMNKAN